MTAPINPNVISSVYNAIKDRVGDVFTKEEVAAAVRDVYATNYGEQASKILGLDTPLNASGGTAVLGSSARFTRAIKNDTPLHIAVLARLMEKADPKDAADAWKKVINDCTP